MGMFVVKEWNGMDRIGVSLSICESERKSHGHG
jgi:hypothetical protein